MPFSETEFIIPVAVQHNGIDFYIDNSIPFIYQKNGNTTEIKQSHRRQAGTTRATL